MALCTWLWLFILSFTCLGSALANSITQYSTGGSFVIPDATCSVALDASGNCAGTVTPQSVSADIFVNASNTVAGPGFDPVQVTLLGFQYVWAGDLTATLTFTPQSGPGTSVDLFNRLGVSNPGDPADVGFGAMFGGSQTAGGNYLFDPAAGNDLWATASGLGTGDGIPDYLGAYFPITANHLASSPSLDTAFTGLNVTGTWTLTVTNYDPAGSQLPAPFPGYNSFTGWQLDLMVDSPEPSYAPLLFALGVAIYAGKRLRHNRA